MEIRVGMVGYGETGRLHATAWRCLPFLAGDGLRVRLVAVSETSGVEAESAQAEAGFDGHTTDPEEVIGHPDVDIVDVCGSVEAHGGSVRSAMAAGKHILCAAPLAYDARDAEELAALSGRTVGRKQMASSLWHLPAVARARALVQDGFLGEPHAFRATVRRGGPIHRAEEGPGSGVGGSVLLGLLPDLVDVARTLNGDIAEVSASIEAYLDEQALGAGPIAEAAWGLLRFANGSGGAVEAIQTVTDPCEDLRFELWGSLGALRFDLAQPDILGILETRTGSGERGWTALSVESTPEGLPISGRLRGKIAGIQAFLDAIARQEAPAPTLRDGLMAHRVLEAVRGSVESGGWQPVDLGR